MWVMLPANQSQENFRPLLQSPAPTSFETKASKSLPTCSDWRQDRKLWKQDKLIFRNILPQLDRKSDNLSFLRYVSTLGLVTFQRATRISPSCWGNFSDPSENYMIPGSKAKQSVLAQKYNLTSYQDSLMLKNQDLDQLVQGSFRSKPH